MITNLESYVKYSFSVLGYTVLGMGPRSKTVTAKTLESSKWTCWQSLCLLLYRPLSRYSRSAKRINKTHHWKEQTKFSKCTNFQESQTTVPKSAIKVLYGERPVQLICHTKPYNNRYWWRFAILWCVTLTIGPLTNFGLLFPVVCFVFVSGQAL